MIDENSKIDEIAEKDSNELIQSESSELLKKIVDENNSDKILQVLQLVNQNQLKKDVARIITYNDILDKANLQAQKRFDKNPDEFSNKELLDYIKVISDALSSSRKNISSTSETPTIQINQQTTEINVENNSEFSQESRNRILDAVAKVLKLTKDNETTVIDADVINEEKKEN